jgi:GT2 family glycosyltransferase
MHNLLIGVVRTLYRAYKYGGLFEVLGSIYLGLNEHVASYLTRFRRESERLWPSESAELYLIKEYRDGPWLCCGSTHATIEVETTEEVCSQLNPKRLIRANSYEHHTRTKNSVKSVEHVLICEKEIEKAIAVSYGQPHVRLRSDDFNSGNYVVDFSLCELPAVSFIIPTRDQHALLKPCIDSIRASDHGRAVEIIVVDNGSTDLMTLNFLLEVEQYPHTRVIRCPSEFNWSRLNNIGARQASGEVLFFLNNDTLAIQNDWITQLACFACSNGIGCVGPMLLYADNSIQHAGVVVGMARWADHIYRGTSATDFGDRNEFVLPKYTRQVTAVTGACMAVSKDRFFGLGGFCEQMRVVFSDIEFCVRAQKSGLRNLYVGDVRLYHFESKSRDSQLDHPADFAIAKDLLEPWRTKKCDPHFHPMLSLTSLTPSYRGTSMQLRRWIR